MTAAAAPLQQQPPPCPVWQPDPAPPPGQIRTDGEIYAIHLPLNSRDWAPWRVVSPEGQALTHAAVHGPQWRVITTLSALLTDTSAHAPEPAAGSTARVFFPGAGQPDDAAAVVTPDGSVWPRSEWHGEHAWMPWSELLDVHGGAVEVPIGELLQRRYDYQRARAA